MKYVYEKMIRTSCPRCYKHIVWLRPKLLEMKGDYETFYICHQCKWIGQVGVGPVKNAKDI